MPTIITEGKFRAGPRQASSWTTTGAWSEAPLPLRSSRSMAAPTDPVGEGRRAQDEVDPHAASLLEGESGVVPVGEGAGLRGVRPDDVDEPGVEDGLERRPLAGGDVALVEVVLHRPDVLVLRRDVPVAHDRGGLARVDRLLGQVAQAGQPVELVDHVGVLDLAAVGHVDRRDLDPAAGGRQRPGLDDRRVAPGGRVREATGRRPRCRRGTRSPRRSSGSGRGGRPRSRAPATGRTGTARRWPWSPGWRGRRRRCVAARPPRGRCGSGSS